MVFCMGYIVFGGIQHAGGDFVAVGGTGCHSRLCGRWGGTFSAAAAINDSCQVAGVVDGNATLWNGTTATDLNSLLDASTVSAGWVLNDATGINDKGWIVGNASNSLLGIGSHAFLLTAAVPEPELTVRYWPG